MAPDDGATWTVTEDVVPIGFTQMTIKQSKNSVKKTLDFKVTNMSNADAKPAPVQLSVVKYWKDKNGNDLDDKEIKVESLPIQIYRREKDAQAWKLFKTAELTADSSDSFHSLRARLMMELPGRLQRGMCRKATFFRHRSDLPIMRLIRSLSSG